MKQVKRTIIAIVLLSAAAAGIAFMPIAQAGPPVCPKIYAPVICDGGKIYSNQCFADRHHAKNCVPYTPGL